MEELERLLEQLQATLTAAEQEQGNLGAGVEEARQGVAALRLARTVRDDAMEALELARRLFEQSLEDYDRADHHLRRARELLARGEE